MNRPDPTVDPRLRSFIPVDPDSDFPIQNLPFGAFELEGEAAPCVAIGDFVVNLLELDLAGMLDGTEVARLRLLRNADGVDGLLLARPRELRQLRVRLSQLLRHDESRLRDASGIRDFAIVPRESVSMMLPCAIGDYTDFYSSREHATNVGIMFRGRENALLPNWSWMPVGYHGRASSVVVSGTDVRRPRGQSKADDAAAPTFGPSRMLDFELEVGTIMRRANALGEPLPIDSARDVVFGLTLVNDWSARDIQKWEYVPLGPFLGKNFCTSMSPWIVTPDALAPFRCAGPTQDPEPLEYLRESAPAELRSYDIQLTAELLPAGASAATVITRTNFKHLYWSIAQQIAHHTSNGCPLRPGDLLASGTISGPTPDSYGSLLELAWRGERPLTLDSGETRSSLQDGDTLTIRGWCSGEYRIGFGAVSGTILPARPG